MHDLPRDHRGHRHGCARDRCRDVHRRRQHPRAARHHAVPAGARPQPHLHHRRSAHAVDRRMERAAEDPRRAAAACDLDVCDEGDHGGILEALDEASETGRDFKMLYRDLLSFMRNLLLVAGRANESMLNVAPEDLPVIRSTAEKFSYSELLRISNLLLRDDETVNRAEHQRLAVEIAVLKAATFPRLRAVEAALAGGPTIAKPAPRRRAPTR